MDFHASEQHVLSICSGGGGLDLGVELALPAARVVCMVEREAHAAARLADAMERHALAPAPIWTDAGTFPGRRFRGCLDGLIGGIPCQPHSRAGKRGGRHDPRDLWSITRRIITQARPWWVLIENVGGMLTANAGDDPGALRVRRDLHRLGFQAEGGLFAALEVGAPQERERVFILAVADPLCVGRDGWPGEPVRRSERGTAPERPGAGPLFPPGPDDVDAWRAYLARNPAHVPGVRLGHHGLAGRLDEGRLLGNGVVPLAGGYAFRTLADRLAARGSVAAAHLVSMMT